MKIHHSCSRLSRVSRTQDDPSTWFSRTDDLLPPSDWPLSASSHRHLRTSAEIFNTEGIRPRQVDAFTKHVTTTALATITARRVVDALVDDCFLVDSRLASPAIWVDNSPQSSSTRFAAFLASLTSRPHRIINPATAKSNDSTTR
ncbi:hypothetical protein L596_026601 [Steinernema carpocapsae]|uniref:Uncharacterized protein n=1 Tax=Steinernema carpocapsae TaxID=34508 RepID=A0A4U5M1X5_STECR|nr:hypothetical protein L596_026601 [Steinernema carpocapsae]